ncbi:hypothetical protein MGMO_44c00300 [Methyloglobulus morosus KoM1]|uniref:Uncharacterized protein n=1 Tax=Methyloglobulus morosus KoM1 TaxID=1116472 RepID=V5BHU2_9GAMM|nr:hypothetical protein [Methyloglobulus morosus]ESS72880.1 hypothetical protein MGMO_44c00300 [Methyloglobulus morosus KoM1]
MTRSARDKIVDALMSPLIDSDDLKCLEESVFYKINQITENDVDRKKKIFDGSRRILMGNACMDVDKLTDKFDLERSKSLLNDKVCAEIVLALALACCEASRYLAINQNDKRRLMTFANQLLGMSSAYEMSGHIRQTNVIVSAKRANKGRIDKFEITKGMLKDYWEKNIDPNKKATDAAILLEKSEVWKNANPQPKRSTLESYVRAWKENLSLQRKL